MLCEKSIMKMVRAYAASPCGKKAIKDKCGIDYDPNMDTGKSLAKMRKVAESAKQILHRHVSSVIGSIRIDDIVMGEPVASKDGTTQITLSFREDALFRQSLQPQMFPHGVEDIVLHFTQGWNAKGSVFGSWHGSDTWSQRAKLPNIFLYNAVLEINKAIKGIAIAELKEEYDKSHI